MNCNKCRDEIEELEGGQLLSQSVNAHLESCPSCSQFREERLALRQMIGSLEVIDAPADFDFRLRARLAAQKGREPGRIAWGRFAPGTRSLALAATFVIIVALGIIVRQFRVAPGVDNGTQDTVKVNSNDGRVPGITGSEPSNPSRNGADGVQDPSVMPPPEEVVKRRKGSNRVNDGNPRVIGGSESLNDGGSSVDSSVSSASSVMPPGISDPTLIRSIVAVPVRTSIQPTSVTLNDGSAKSQTISLRPVTFGEQDVFEQRVTKWGGIQAVRGIW